MLAQMLAVVGLAFASSAVAQEMVRLTGLPPGKVTYKALSEIGNLPDARLIASEFQQGKTDTTAGGVRFFIYDDVPAEVSNIINYEKERMTRPKASEKVAGLPDVSKSRFASLKLAAYSIEDQHADRVFADSDGTEVLFRDWNFARDGASVLVVREFCNTDVNGTPATFAALRNGTAPRVQWRLSWTTDERQYDLIMVGDESADRAFDYLMKLARSL